MDLLVGLDIGTTSVKGVLLSPDGRTIIDSKRSVPLLYPQPGNVEIDPQTHYGLVCELIQELVSRKPRGSVVCALSMAVASGNTLLLDERLNPITNIISWLDERAVGKTSELLPDLQVDQVHSVVGWPWIEMFPMAQLSWFRKRQPKIYRAVKRYGMNIDHLIYRWTGEWCIDTSNATTTYLQNQTARKWNPSYLAMLDIPIEGLPEIRSCGSVVGQLSPQGARDTGLTESTQIVLGSFDHPCAARSTGMLREGDLLISCGTSWAALFPIGQRNKALLNSELLIDPFLSPHGPWACIGALRGIGVDVEWYIDNFVVQGKKVEDKYSIFNKAAAIAPPGAGGLFLRFRPGNRPLAPEGASVSCIARAVMEGAAFSLRIKMEELAKLGITANRIAMVGGPSESNVWTQIVADVTGLEMRLLNGQNAGAVGAAIIAGIASGIFKDEDMAFQTVCSDSLTLVPDTTATSIYEKLYQDYREECMQL